MTRPVDPALTTLRDQLLRMGSLAEAILEKSLQSLFQRDAALAREVKLDDLELDRLDIAIDDQVLRILATQAPVADDLRNVIAGKMIAADLERIGDLARNIAKSAERLAARAEVETPPRLRTLADEAQRILRRALDAFAQSDPARAALVLDDDDQVDADEDAVIRNAIEEIASRPEFTAQEVDFILIAKNLERVADHATNIAEDVILATQARNVKHAAKLAK
ncbi:MAG TPA: phosphate signaling complex protein PhoU [Myxococcota bacterium]|nr:phosphate signaling complex protein PhoU [Myxococcota bacterium]